MSANDLDDELSTDAIGIPPRSEPEHESRNDDTCIRSNASESEITLGTHETCCPQTNNQSQSETLVKTFLPEDTNVVRNDNNLVASDDLLNQNDDSSQNVRNACELRHDHPTLSEEFEENCESTEPKIKPPEEVKQTHDKNALDQVLSNLKLPSEHLGTHETCPKTSIQSQSETLVKTFLSEDTDAVRNDNNLVSSDDLLNQIDDSSQNVRNVCELGHDHPILSKEFEVNEPIIIPPEDAKQTQDINALDQALSNLKLPPEHLGTHETGCPKTNIQSQSEKLEKSLQSENTNATGNENNLDSNHDDRRSNILSADEFAHDHPRISKEVKVNSESTVPNINPLEEVKQTHDQASSNLILPPEPPLEWRLNELLDDIAMEIPDSEFKRIKLMFTGPESLGENLLNECDTCIKLFTVLKQRKYISRDNILYLNKILYILGRRDLILRCVRYCSEEGNVIHYYSNDGEPGSGARYVKIHVVADVQKYNKEALDQLRNYVATLVCAPIEVIVISAVEPGSSFLITFTMPDIYVDVLKDLLQQKVNLWKLSSLQVDIIIVDDIHYDVSGHFGARMVTEQYIKIRNVYEQLNDKRKQLEQLEITYLQCMEELENLKPQLEKTEKLNHELTTTCSMLQKMHLTFSVTDAALDGLRSLMQEASDKGQDMGLIQKIINSNTEITAAYHRCLNEMKLEEQTLKIKERKLRDKMLLRELSLKLKSAEEILHTKYSQHTLDFNLTLNLDATKTLYDTSKTLKDEARNKLINKATWSKDDVVKACIETDEGLLLLGLECKQAEQTQERVDTVKLLSLLGEQIGKDLLKMYNQIAEHKRKQDQEKKRKELNLQLLKQLTSKSKSSEEIVLTYAESFSFTSMEKSLPAACFVKQMSEKSKGLIIFLNEEECTKLLSFCTWYEKDAIKECIREDRRLLLPGVLCKEMERAGEIILPEEMLKRLQDQIERKDLLGLFDQVKTDEMELQVQIDLWHKRKKNESQLFKMLSSGISAEEVLLLKLSKYTLKLADDFATKPLFKKVAKLLGALSGKVNKNEKTQLIELYKWDKNDIILECIAADKDLLFEGIWCKDMDITQSIPDIEGSLSSMCRKINRTDLFDEFKENFEILLLPVLDKTARYFFCDPIEHNMSVPYDAGASSIPRNRTLPIKTEPTYTDHLPSFAISNPYSVFDPD